ncbi:MAG: hypothetical protein KGL77_01865 [Actinomycetales bacterium]|nr:hypothetical protein [Actinomycetales bacterium]
MRIIASTAIEQPRFATAPDGDLELLVHFGHTAEDIVDAASLAEQPVPVDEFVALWSDPECPRSFEDIGGTLVIRPAEDLPVYGANGLQ